MRLLILIMLVLLPVSGWGAGLQPDLSLWQGGNKGDILKVYFPLTSSLSGKAPNGGLTFARASTQIIQDHEGMFDPVASGSAAFPGTRVVTNLCLSGDDFSTWSKQNGAASTATSITFAATSNSKVARGLTGLTTGQVLRASVVLSSATPKTCTLFMVEASPPYTVYAQKTIAVTSTPKRFSMLVPITKSSGSASFQIANFTAESFTVQASGAQVEDVTGQSNQNPGEYVPTTTAAVSQSFTYLNPHTVDAGGVVTDSGARTPVSTAMNGILLEPASTNKVTCYSALTESLGSELSSGDSVVGRVYRITARSAIDWNTYGTLLSGSSNTVGATYVITSAFTFTGSDKAQEVLNAISTKAIAASTTAIRGMTLGGATAATAEIVTKTLSGTPYANIGNNRVVRVVNSDAGTVTITFAGTAGNTNKHSGFLVAAKTAGSGTSTLEINGNTTAISGSTLTLYKLEDKTPASGSQLVLNVGAGDTVEFTLPQLEEKSYVTSPIITQGATATRAATALSMATSGNFVDAMGMVALDYTPGVTAAETYGLFSVSGSAASVLYHDGTGIKGTDGTTTVSKTVTPTAGNTYKSLIKWNTGGNMGITVGGAALAAGAYDGSFGPGATATIGVSIIPAQIKNLRIWHKPLSDAKCLRLTQ